MIERVPPQNIEAEQAVIGGMLIEKEAISKVAEFLKADDFYREAHRLIFEAMLELFNKNEAVDLVTVTEVLRKNDKLEAVGGIAYITSLANSVPTAANINYHGKIVEEKALLRGLINSATHIASMGYEDTEAYRCLDFVGYRYRLVLVVLLNGLRYPLITRRSDDFTLHFDNCCSVVRSFFRLECSRAFAISFEDDAALFIHINQHGITVTELVCQHRI